MLTDDQVMHYLGIDLDGLYGTAEIKDENAMRRGWFETFGAVAASIGIEPGEIGMWPRRWLCGEIERINGPLNRGLMMSALHDYLKANPR
jgi:hypothetical protein